MRILFVLCLALLWSPVWLLSQYAVAAAHTVQLLQSEPAAGAVLHQSPTQVHIDFAEELRSRVSKVGVFDGYGQAVDQGDGGLDLSDPNHARLIVNLPSLPAGVYTVRWRAVLDDGDASVGEFTFTIGKAAPGLSASLGNCDSGTRLADCSPDLLSYLRFNLLATNVMHWYAGLGGLLIIVSGFFVWRRRGAA
jgi:methionine-rich copper-binding protein CopC